MKIVNLDLFRRTKQLEAKKTVDIPDDKSESSKPSLSYPEMAKIRDELCTFWNLYNKNDKLDYFFYTTLKIPPKKYSDDLNEIARIESNSFTNILTNALIYIDLNISLNQSFIDSFDKSIIIFKLAFHVILNVNSCAYPFVDFSLFRLHKKIVS